MANISIPDSLMKELEQIVAHSQEFADVSAYVSYILEQVVAKKKQTIPATATGSAATYSKEDEDKIRERLKNLGYLD